MILSLQEFKQSKFRGVNLVLSPLTPSLVQKLSQSANTSFQEALLAVHGNNDATLPFPSFDQGSCELKVAHYRALKRVTDRLLPSPRLFSLCYFSGAHSIYWSMPTWIRLYLLKKNGAVQAASEAVSAGGGEEAWACAKVDGETQGIVLSILEDPEDPGIADWSRLQQIPREGSTLRLAQFLEKPNFGESGHQFMPLWFLNLLPINP